MQHIKLPHSSCKQNFYILLVSYIYVSLLRIFPPFLFLFSIFFFMEMVTDVPVPVACAILVCLFMLQHYGTHKIGFIFAPIVIIWLLFISGVGIYNIFHWNQHIFRAMSPTYMYNFVINTHVHGWRSLGSIILCVAGMFPLWPKL